MFLFVSLFLGLHLRHKEIPRLGVESELQLPDYSTATATQDLSCIWDLHHSSQQCRILNPLSEAGDQTCILMDTSQVLNPLSHNGNSLSPLSFNSFGSPSCNSQKIKRNKRNPNWKRRSKTVTVCRQHDTIHGKILKMLPENY